MFGSAFSKLDLSEVALQLDRINEALNGEIVFDPVETTILSADLSFYPGCRLLDITNQADSPILQRFAVISDDQIFLMDYTNTPIYEMNRAIPLNLLQETVIHYVRFFFHFVKGRHGRFLLVESVDDINWKDEPPPSARKAIGKMLSAIEILDHKDGQFHLSAKMVFKDSLFRSDIHIDSHGTVTLKNEELLVEDMPVLDDVFGQ